MKKLTFILLTFCALFVFTSVNSIAQPYNNCENEANQIPCPDPWTIHIRTVWVPVPGMLNCKVQVTVAFYKRCNVFQLISTSIQGPLLDLPNGCIVGNTQYLDSHEFHAEALRQATGAFLVSSIPICGQGAPSQTTVFATTCLRSVITYTNLTGGTTSMNYNPALGLDHYLQLITSLTGMQSPQYVIETVPCGSGCCKQEIAYCKMNGQIVIMVGAKTLISGSCDPDPELYCRSSDCQ